MTKHSVIIMVKMMMMMMMLILTLMTTHANKHFKSESPQTAELRIHFHVSIVNCGSNESLLSLSLFSSGRSAKVAQITEQGRRIICRECGGASHFHARLVSRGSNESQPCRQSQFPLKSTGTHTDDALRFFV